MTKKIILGSAVVILIFLFVILETGGYFTKNESKSFYVEKGMGFSQITEGLSSADFINSSFVFKAYARLFYKDSLNKISAGKLTCDERMSYSDIMKTLIDGERENEDVKVTVPEGYELREIADLLYEKGLIDRKKFYDAVKNYDFNYDFVKGLEKRDNRLEGFLFPDTYMFSKTLDDEISIINKMLARFREIYNKYSDGEKRLGFSSYEVITLASIVEREGKNKSDFKKVSSVFHNRLKRNDHLGLLQSCATVQYILKERKTVLSVSDTKIDSPYNTYKYKGLPKGPIASPGEAAIEAVFNPEKTDYLYFLNDKSGKLHFSKTLEEHNRKVSQYVN